MNNLNIDFLKWSVDSDIQQQWIVNISTAGIDVGVLVD